MRRPTRSAQHADLLARFLRASARGWGFAYANRDKAVALLVKQYPNLVAADERAAADVMLDYAFDEHTKAGGYGTMDPAVWQDQIDLYAKLGQFTKRTPKLDEVMTLTILNATAGRGRRSADMATLAARRRDARCRADTRRPSNCAT